MLTAQHPLTRSPKLQSLLQPGRHSDWFVDAMESLVEVVQELSHARDLETITEIVRDAARNLTGADGATFILRDGDQCYYADENAIAPLWKGRRFPMEICLSGWVMRNAAPALIEDIYKDARVLHSVYRPTFVQSLAMVPIRTHSPIGAIGNYWAHHHKPSLEEITLLRALADTTSVAIENVDLYNQLQHKIAELEDSNYELSCFAWAASLDLQEPLRTIVTQVELLERRYNEQLDERAFSYIRSAVEAAKRLQRLIGDLLVHARAGKTESFQTVSLNEVVQAVLDDLRVAREECGAIVEYDALPEVIGNRHLLECLMRNLLSNAIKFRISGTSPRVRISARAEGNEWLVNVRDNGTGIDPAYHERIFGLFQRLHSQDKYPGSGIGLATCRKIIDLHNGRIWVEPASGPGSLFCFTLPLTAQKEK